MKCPSLLQGCNSDKETSSLRVPSQGLSSQTWVRGATSQTQLHVHSATDFLEKTVIKIGDFFVLLFLLGD